MIYCWLGGWQSAIVAARFYPIEWTLVVAAAAASWKPRVVPHRNRFVRKAVSLEREDSSDYLLRSVQLIPRMEEGPAECRSSSVFDGF